MKLYQKVHKPPECCALIIFFPCFLGFVLSPGSGLPLAPIYNIVPLASSEDQVMAEVFTASPLVASANQMLQAGQEIEKLLESEMLSHLLFTKF